MLVHFLSIAAPPGAFVLLSSFSKEIVDLGESKDGVSRALTFSQIFLGLFLLIGFHAKFSKRKGQFIEWAPNQIQFKTREQEGIIPVGEIENVDIDIDSITIILISGMKYTLDIQDFGDYEIRLKIKDNFNKLKKISA